jgi:predicted transcriptional regulator YdeE
MAYLGQHHHQIRHITDDRTMYEVHISHEETGVTGEHEVFVGLEVAELEEVPVELSVKVLPAVTYAVFTLRGSQITSDWTQMILTDWMPTSNYEMAHPYSIQRYDERFKGVDHIEESVLDVYVPVKR